MFHKIKLSNGETIGLLESKDQLSIHYIEKDDESWFVASISRNGVLVAPNSFDAAEDLTNGLLDSAPQPAN